jgi:GMP synthase (glutamine-hydrolysing)
MLKAVPAKENTTLSQRNSILILDFGGQYTHLIGRNIRENKVYSEIFPCETSSEKLKEIITRLNVKGIILSGGPDSVYDTNAPTFDPKVLELGIPILGLCYGHQLIAHLSKGRVEQSLRKEYGNTKINISDHYGILAGLQRTETVWMSHGDTVQELSPDYMALASSENTPVAAFRHRNLQIYGLQFHPEVTQTESGIQILRNFIFNECKCEPNWVVTNFIDDAIKKIKDQVKDDKCIVTLSGGVDSSTSTALMGRAIGNNLIVVYVDTGLMRENETEEVKEIFCRTGVDLRVIDAKERFLNELKGVTDPEQKRKIIGNLFIKIFEEQIPQIDAKYLVQGTIYPDRVESGKTGKSALIKSHHNVGGIPDNIKFEAIVEPLRDLYKDEVRRVAAELGLPDSIVNRQPFPGPGLAIRVIGEVTAEKLGIVRKADYIVTSEIEKAGLARGLWQYFAVLTDTESVGIKGDARAYGPTIAFRALVSREAMTAKFAWLSEDLVRTISTRITNEIPEVTRVVYDVTDKPPGTVEWE